MRTLLTNATPIDCVHPQALECSSVLIKDGRIHAIRMGAHTDKRRRPTPHAGG